MPELLIELLSEEIPARMQARAAEDFKRLVCERLAKAQLAFTSADAYVTPRRLTLVVDGLPERQPDVREERKGPRVGSPDKAVQGFLRAAGLSSIDQAEVRETDKGPSYFAAYVRAGAATPEVLASILIEVLTVLPWPKSMRWGAGHFRWVRPLHNILAVFNGAPLAASQPLGADLTLSGNASTQGHRFLAPGEIGVTDFADYAAKLNDAKVMLDPAERRALIARKAEALAAAEGLSVRADEALLDEVTGLVEWPVPMLGSIDPRFMDVPAEVLITAMRAHQKYFSLLDADGRLAPRFVLVANTEASDGGAAIVAGNERVLRARLSDAKFFWDEDRKRTLESRVPKLAERVFHAKLGSDLQRTQRLGILASVLAPLCGGDARLASRAAALAKADLMSAMVGEFPELQGIMGRYYARHDGEAPEVAEAIADHYAPQGPSDRCPTTPVSIAVALADKIDTLAGFFAIGEKPTGSKDPFALRRAALAVIRLIIENGLRLNLRPLFESAQAAYPDGTTQSGAVTVCDDLLAFLADRLKVHLREQGVRHDLVSAVFADGNEDDLVRLLARVDALRDFLTSDDGANLLVAYRRASNIVRIEENKDKRHYVGEVDEELLAENQESDLYRALSEARDEIAAALSDERFRDAMAILAGLRKPVDAFFDRVQVNCADAQRRENRLKLLSQIRSALGGVADFAQIEG
ncbi:MAG: glycine--tRNA ligase subunit beta [Rhodospirillales bacterium]|nr:glycine--tRNA ligase subunit beta [Rhodospirillales bacterium]